MDLMTYCMYTLANKDPEAMKNETILADLVNRVFQIFFQHFISTNLSTTEPSWAYQPVGAQAENLGDQLFYNRSEGYMRRVPPPTYLDQKTNRSVDVVIQYETEVLKMNAVATWLTIAIASLLAVGTTAALIMQRSYLKPMRRNIECIADVLVLIAGSERLLKLARQGGLEKGKASDDVVLKLGWFKTKAGEKRWGIELVEDSPDAVEWVEEPASI